MIIIEGLYIAFYRFSNFFKKNVPGSFFYHERFDSIMIMTLLALLNFSSIWMLFELKPIITTHLFDFFLGFILIGGLNILYFERKKKYKVLIVKYQKKSFFFLGWIYGVASIAFFIYFHSRN
jgi:hypothetical protein